MTLDKDDLLKLYELNVTQEHYFLTEHQNRVNFFAGILTTLIGATIYGIVNIKKEYLWLMLLGAIIIIITSIIARQAVERLYQRFLEVITQRAKLEHRLGMAGDELSSPGKPWYETEPLVNKRYLEDRSHGKDSKEFVKNRMKEKKTYHAFVTYMFFVGALIGVLIEISIIILGIK